MIPGTCRARRRLPAAAGPDAGGRRADHPGGPRRRWDYELETIERWGGTRSPLDTPLWEAIAAGSRRPSPARSVAPLCCCRLHRLPLAARGVRHGRVRLLPDADDGARARGAADPLRRRADARRRPRARRRLPARGGALAGLDRARAPLARRRLRADRGVPARARLLRARRRGPRRRSLPRLRALGAAAPHERRRRRPSRARCPLAAVRRSRTGPGSVPRTRLGSASGSGRGATPTTATRSRRCATRSRAATSTRSTSSSTSARDFEGDPRALAAAARAGSGRASLAGDGWAIVSASPELFLARRGRTRLDEPIKGTRPLGEHVEGEKDAAEHVMIVDLERNDLSRVCEPGSRALARADGRAGARGRHASRLDGRGHAARRTSGSPSCSRRRSRAARSPARRRSPRST